MATTTSFSLLPDHYWYNNRYTMGFFQENKKIDGNLLLCVCIFVQKNVKKKRCSHVCNCINGDDDDGITYTWTFKKNMTKGLLPSSSFTGKIPFLHRISMKITFTVQLWQKTCRAYFLSWLLVYRLACWKKVNMVAYNVGCWLKRMMMMNFFYI